MDRSIAVHAKLYLRQSDVYVEAKLIEQVAAMLERGAALVEVSDGKAKLLEKIEALIFERDFVERTRAAPLMDRRT